MKFKKHYLLLLLPFLLNACKSTKETTTEIRTLPEITVNPDNVKINSYRASYPKIHDLLHTSLDVKFDWAKKYLYGKATLTLKPHFYPSESVSLDARGMDILRVAMLQDNDTIALKYVYTHDTLTIQLNRNYSASENFRLYIDYIAKPEELKSTGGSKAITSDKGLYFINPDGKEKGKPMQIWTQGETQSNSVWFPTIEATNQKMTQDISITVDNAYTTLSNGLLVKSTVNADGTRTDFWKQDLPHAPYLVMMAIGKFSVVKDSWQGKEVSYYVEPKYEKVAKQIFGNTPEMMTYFSKITGVEYPWAKYNQVVVRDYVSGAMENTTATVHGDFMQQDERELLDGTNEDVISHELFHQWFGDYVTAESWSNIPLNESFATYGEYLWNEYKYGRDVADIYKLIDLNIYLRSAKSNKVNLIRFYYDNREDLFDRNSYQKGGTILHMLRKYVGDDAFFASLKLYLQTNKYKSVEVHQLRLAFEEITGEDLNWFFNQWFYDKGHPVLDITYDYKQENKTASVTIKQTQDLSESPVYRIPMDVDIYTGTKVNRKRIILDSKEQRFTFPCDQKPDLINVDAEKMITGVLNDKHSKEEWMFMYRKAPLFQDRMDALLALSKDYTAGNPEAEIILEALKDKNYRIREIAVNNIEGWAKSDRKAEVKKTLMSLGKNDSKSDVRDAAISALISHYSDEDVIPFLKNTISDSSFMVMETSLLGLAERDKEGALAIASSMEGNSHEQVYRIISTLYAKYGSDSQFPYMKKALDNSAGMGMYRQLKQHGKFMQRCNDDTNIRKGLLDIYNYGKLSEEWTVRLSAVQTLAEYGNFSASQSALSTKANDKVSFEKWNALTDIAAKYNEELKKNEKNEMLLKIYSSGK